MGPSMSWMGQGSPQERQMGELLVLPSRRAGCGGSVLWQAVAAILQVRLPGSPGFAAAQLVC